MNFFEELQGNYEEPLTNLIQVVNKKTHETTTYDYYIGRPSILSNPYSAKPSRYTKERVSSREEALALYEEYFQQQLSEPLFLEELEKLKNIFEAQGKLNLVCWCAPKRCHGEIIKKWLIKQV